MALDQGGRHAGPLGGGSSAPGRGGSLTTDTGGRERPPAPAASWWGQRAWRREDRGQRARPGPVPRRAARARAEVLRLWERIRPPGGQIGARCGRGAAVAAVGRGRRGERVRQQGVEAGQRPQVVVAPGDGPGHRPDEGGNHRGRDRGAGMLTAGDAARVLAPMPAPLLTTTASTPARTISGGRIGRRSAGGEVGAEVGVEVRAPVALRRPAAADAGFAFGVRLRRLGLGRRRRLLTRGP